jgi:hypothetical protein
MGNRYGRNQKRKHREIIQRLLEQTIKLSNENVQLKNEVEYFLRMDREIAQTLGTATAFRLVTDKIRTSNTEPEQMHLNMFNRPMYAYTDGTGQLLQEIQTTKHHLKKLFTHIQADPQKYGSYIKVLVGNETKAAIFVDNDYLFRSGLTPRDIEYLSKHLAEELGTFINQHYQTERDINHVNRQNSPEGALLLR